ncbi:MAG TPA: roadblock/LC7 domain-containing protein [Candidatus Deferrimicrobiaceae bacterium]
MSFREIIEGIHGKDRMVRGGALTGSDGLPVEEWAAGPDLQDLSALCAEMAQFFKESDRISRENGMGECSEVFLAGDRGQVFFRRVDGEYFLLLVADPGAIPGKCRFLLRQGASRAREIL